MAIPASYNVAPTQDVPVVRVNKEGAHTGSLMHWGLIPYWAKGIPPKFSTINATVEKLTEAASWRGYSPMAGPFGHPCPRPATATQRRDSESPPGLRPLPLLWQWKLPTHG
jgi:hypothetical protein